jgi:outer membrane protein
MRNPLILGAIALALIAAAPRPAAAAPASKVGYVDLHRTLLETAAGKKVQAKLEAEKAEKQKLVDAKKKAFRDEVAEFDKQRVVMKPELVAKRQAELQEKYVELQDFFMGIQQELAKKEAELTKDIFVKASGIIESIAKRDGFTMILERSESVVLWADPSVDITNEVNKRIDAAEGGK